MNFAEGVTAAYEKKWSYVNAFTVQFHFSAFLKDKVGWTTEEEDGMNIHIKGMETPQYTNSPVEVYIGDQWRIHNGRNEMWRFTISFRDSDQMKLYRKFVSTYNWQKTAYFDDASTTITLFKDGDYYKEKDERLFFFKNVMIESVGQVQFSNETENQIVEFDIQFKCPAPEVIPASKQG